ncbi:hypothetical protein GNI_008910 [Gregarina niphandrodes]|uniref:Uncharacterized protein n=1 Tax=Gregarina niphandrodes TaxID=110365 RepID=A0A023BCX2_GRENI|nr:hypothetical protein GNI_008910 [Gregarina niphandrodes]EZG86957.1 hypothetical protein GNI_008910 [Gregarina niphandrodes]|eukprot:XP_011128732.1 hypothetical protein GNI_008910 [Gregarina niphandrodes]
MSDLIAGNLPRWVQAEEALEGVNWKKVLESLVAGSGVAGGGVAGGTESLPFSSEVIPGRLWQMIKTEFTRKEGPPVEGPPVEGPTVEGPAVDLNGRRVERCTELLKRALCLDTWSVAAGPLADVSGGGADELLLSLSSIYERTCPERDLTTLILEHLQTAADGFLIDAREVAAAHYHMGKYLKHLVDAVEEVDGNKALKKLVEKREAQAIWHLTKARDSFNPSYCIKDFQNVHMGLFAMISKRDITAATASMLAADLYACLRKAEKPRDNIWENDEFIMEGDEYIGVTRLRILAQQGMIQIIKNRDAIARSVSLPEVSSSLGRTRDEQNTDDVPPSFVTMNKTDKRLFDTTSDHINLCLIQGETAMLKNVLMSLLKKKSYHHFFHLKWD